LRQFRRVYDLEVNVSNQKTVDQRLAELELALKTAIVFNMNAAAVLGRRLAFGNDAIASVISQDLKNLKAESFEGIDKALHDSYLDNLSQAITGRA
jgi:hypothetical protein